MRLVVAINDRCTINRDGRRPMVRSIDRCILRPITAIPANIIIIIIMPGVTGALGTNIAFLWQLAGKLLALITYEYRYYFGRRDEL